MNISHRQWHEAKDSYSLMIREDELSEDELSEDELSEQ